MKICVLFRPDLEPAHKGALPRWKRSAEVVSYTAGERKGTASKIPAITQKQIVFRPGVNMIDSEEYEKALAHAAAAVRLKNLIKCNAVKVVTPDAEVQLNCSTDFTDESIALEVVNAQQDEKWLEFSLKRDDRLTVLDAIKERLNLIEEQRKAVQ
jgi:hypothetical protein